MSFDPPSERLLAAYLDDSSAGFAEIDPATGAVSFLTTVGGTGNSGALDPDQRSFFIDRQTGQSQEILILDADTGAELGSIDVPGFEYGYLPF